MNREWQLKLQAWADGELAEGEASGVQERIHADPEASALVSELRMTRGFLAGNEVERPVPESREFYWSRIRREIERADSAAAAGGGDASPVWAGLRRFFAPLSGFALVLCVALFSVKLFFGTMPVEDATAQLVEVENLSEDMASISYRSQADNMFVVYLYPKDRPAVSDETDMDALDELLFQ